MNQSWFHLNLSQNILLPYIFFFQKGNNINSEGKIHSVCFAKSLYWKCHMQFHKTSYFHRNPPPCHPYHYLGRWNAHFLSPHPAPLSSPQVLWDECHIQSNYYLILGLSWRIVIGRPLDLLPLVGLAPPPPPCLPTALGTPSGKETYMYVNPWGNPPEALMPHHWSDLDLSAQMPMSESVSSLADQAELQSLTRCVAEVWDVSP